MKLIIALLMWSNDLGNKVHLMTRTSYEHLRDGKTAPRKIVSQQIPPWVRVSVESNLLGEGGQFPVYLTLKLFENRLCVSWFVNLTH